MKINIRRLFVNLLIIFLLLDGAVWEIVSLFLIGFFLLSEMCKRTTRIQKWNAILFFVMVWFAYMLYQSFKLGLDSQQLIRLYGITKTLCMPCIMILCFYDKAADDVIFSIIPSVFIIGILGIVAYTFGLQILAFRGLNYIGAVLIALSIYIIKALPEQYRLRKWLFLLLLVIVTALSGSRSLLLVITMVLIYICFTEENHRKRVRYFMILAVVCVVLVAMVAYVGLNYNFNATRSGTDVISNIARALTVFTSEGRLDQARTDLKTRALAQYASYNDIQKLIGSGDNRVNIGMTPVHNCFLEVLLCYGSIGEALFVIFLLFQIRIVLANSIDRKYAVIIIGVWLLFGLVQPFITTGTIFQVIIGLLFVNCMQKKDVYNIFRREKNGKVCCDQ